MGKTLFPQTNLRHHLYYFTNRTLIPTTAKQEKRPFHSAISILFCHLMKTSPLKPSQKQNPRLNQKSILVRSIALQSLPRILIPTPTRFQFRQVKIKTQTQIQILKLEISGLGLGLVGFDTHLMANKIMKREINKMVKASTVLNQALAH